MEKIRVADYITNYLYKKYDVEHIFMLSGGGSIYLDDSVALHPHVKDICVRNEATAPMMANGYVKSGKKLGVAYVTTGPGSANAASGLVESWVDSCPVLIVSGQVNSYQTIQSKRNNSIKPLRSYGTQELDILSMVKPITKMCLRLENPLNVKKYLDILINKALSDRKGPVWLEIPLDIQKSYIDEKDLEEFSIESVFNRLMESKKPLILAGQGIRNSSEFKKFINLIDIPFILSRMALDSIPYEYKYNLGIGGIKGRLYNKLIMKNSDLIISIGTTLSPAFVGYNLEFLGKDIIIVDIDDSELNKFDGIDKNIIKIKMDASEFCEKLLFMMMHDKYDYVLDNYDIGKWQNYALDIKSKNKIELKGTTPIDIYDFVKTLDVLSSEGDIFVSDAGSSYYVTQQTLEFNKKNQKDITSGAYASMGVSIPLAIGASLNNKDKNIIVVTGDGSIETNIQELKTVSYYGLNIKIFVINNGGYISMRDHQDKLFDGRYINATDETGNPVLNFGNIANAFGLKYLKIDKYEDLKEKILYSINYKGPILIEVVCNSHQKLIDPVSYGDTHEWMA